MNLFICMTNLHLLIAKTIIVKEHLKEVDILFIGDSNNNKNKLYLRKMEPYCRHINIVPHAAKSSTLKTFKRTQYAKKILRQYSKHYDCIFFANLHVPIIHHILSQLSFGEIKTFDDGTNNINPNSSLYAGNPVKLTSKIIHRFWGRKYHKEDVLRLAKKHYTLFPGRKNVIDRTEEIILYKYNDSLELKTIKKVLLGTVYADALKDKALKEQLLQKLQSFILHESIDIYIPHPRDSYNYFKNVEHITSDLIAEDLILNYLKQGIAIELYGFNSTAQVNLDNIRGINNYKLKSQLFNECFNYGLEFSFKEVEL